MLIILFKHEYLLDIQRLCWWPQKYRQCVDGDTCLSLPRQHRRNSTSIYFTGKYFI